MRRNVQRSSRLKNPTRAAAVSAAANNAAHVTIGFAAESIAQGKLIALLERVAQASTPFDLRFDQIELGTDHRDARGYAFWVPSQGRDEVIALHDRLHNDPDLAYPINRAVPYRPHITLAARPTKEAAQDHVEELSTQRLVAQARISHLRLVALFRDLVESVARIRLGDGTREPQ